MPPLQPLKAFSPPPCGFPCRSCNLQGKWRKGRAGATGRPPRKHRQAGRPPVALLL